LFILVLHFMKTKFLSCCIVEDSEMDQVVEMRNLIKDGTIVSRLQGAPSYVQPFLSETFDENIILIYKKLVGLYGVSHS
jgi:hypothetical protein